MTSDGTSLEKLPGDVEGLIFFTETEQHKLLIVGQNDKEKSVYAVPNSDRAGKTRCKFYFDHDTAASYESVKVSQNNTCPIEYGADVYLSCGDQASGELNSRSSLEAISSKQDVKGSWTCSRALRPCSRP